MTVGSLDEIVDLVMRKKEFSVLDRGFVERLVSGLLREADVSSERDVKDFVKFVRGKLRNVYGMFWLSSLPKLKRLVNNLVDEPSLESYVRVLKLHQSSRERLSFYDVLYKRVFELTKKPSSVLDLGCGLNPFSLPFFGFVPVYYAQELSPVVVDVINFLFKGVSVRGSAFASDLTVEFPSVRVDVVFLFKLLDTLEDVRSGVSLELLNHLCRFSGWLVVSFPTRTLSGRKTIRSVRSWFLSWVDEREFFTLEFPNELFYVVRCV